MLAGQGLAVVAIVRKLGTICGCVSDGGWWTRTASRAFGHKLRCAVCSGTRGRASCNWCDGEKNAVRYQRATGEELLRREGSPLLAAVDRPAPMRGHAGPPRGAELATSCRPAASSSDRPPPRRGPLEGPAPQPPLALCVSLWPTLHRPHHSVRHHGRKAENLPTRFGEEAQFDFGPPH